MAEARAARPSPTVRDPAERSAREFVTPEGVDLRLEVADGGERAAAFLLDALIITAVLIGATFVALGAAWATRGEAVEWVAVVWLLLFFLLRNAWFIGFELRPAAATPGKRMLGLRVAARNGGRLTADAVIARNLTRELEVFLPLSFLVVQQEAVDAWMVLFGLVWSGVFVFLPLFNRDRLRAGDLIAGTWVVRAPKRPLSSDLAGAAPAPGLIVFTPEQIDVYGVKELHVLEEVLRRRDRKVMRAVADRIRRKIDWTGGEEPDEAFLRAYYVGLRQRLETKLLFGRRKKDKFDAG